MLLWPLYEHFIYTPFYAVWLPKELYVRNVFYGIYQTVPDGQHWHDWLSFGDLNSRVWWTGCKRLDSINSVGKWKHDVLFQLFFWCLSEKHLSGIQTAKCFLLAGIILHVPAGCKDNPSEHASRISDGGQNPQSLFSVAKIFQLF